MTAHEPMPAASTAEAAPVASSLALRTLGLTRSFGDVRAVDRVDLEVTAGELLAVLGPSGCGKTTLLRLVAGFDVPDAGGIEIAGRVVTGPRRATPPEDRHVGVVFQEPALFPHLDVAGNVGFGIPRRDRPARVTELISLVGLEGLDRRMPYELSGGQQQRVAIARALGPRPALMLLDEPFSALDATLRGELRLEVREILRGAGATCILVTHDQAEALQISDRVAVMRDGRIEQVGTPDEVYLRPVNRFVAGFVGRANLISGTVEGREILTPLGRFAPAAGYRLSASRALVLLRPEQVEMTVVDRGREASGPEVLRVVRRVFHGSTVHHTLRAANGFEIEAATPPGSALEVGTEAIARPLTRDVPVYPRGED